MRKSTSGALIVKRNSLEFGEAVPSRNSDGRLSLEHTLEPRGRPALQLCAISAVTLGMFRFANRLSRTFAVLVLWTGLEALRVTWFRRLGRSLGHAALRAPVARRGVSALSRVTSDPDLKEDGAGQTCAQVALCKHLSEALSRGHRFQESLRPVFVRRGWSNDFQSWQKLLHAVLSNSGTVAVRSAAIVELRRLSAACSGESSEREPLPDGLPWGIAAVDCAWPRPLLFEVLQAAVREILSLGLRARGFRPRKVYVKVATAEIEYLVWVHPGPKSLPAVPCVFLHGVGSGATLYGRLLSHLALGRRVIAVEVPGVSQGQMSEAGSAAILDGLPQAVASALGPTTTYDVVGHSGGGWWSSVLMRAVRRRQLPAPRRLLIMQSPCFAPSFLRIMLLGQTDVRDAIPTPYIGGTWTQRVFFRLLGLCAHTVAAKDIWNIHCMNVGFAADELVVLPETVVPHPETSVLFIFGERDPYTLSEKNVLYLRDMLPAPHIKVTMLAGAGHGTFLLFLKEWLELVEVMDRFLERGHSDQ